MLQRWWTAHDGECKLDGNSILITCILTANVSTILQKAHNRIKLTNHQRDLRSNNIFSTPFWLWPIFIDDFRQRKRALVAAFILCAKIVVCTHFCSWFHECFLFYSGSDEWTMQCIISSEWRGCYRLTTRQIRHDEVLAQLLWGPRPFECRLCSPGMAFIHLWIRTQAYPCWMNTKT